MATMTSCPDCGATIPPDAPGGACPGCLLESGIAPPLDDALDGVPPPEELTALFPDLEILKVLGRGGMGVVFQARQKGLDRLVALKLVPRVESTRPGFAERFSREARALARLDHPNIVRVHGFGERSGIYFLLMEFVDGATLRDAMDAEALDPRQTLAVVRQICDALQFAHDQGVVHRDIKPENVLMTRDGVVKVADFGLAKLTAQPGEASTLTRAGQVMGTLHYMAPEQVESPNSVDHRADIYSLGVVMYEMVTGDLPIGRFEPPSRIAPVDERLDDVVEKALSRRRDQRYQRVSEIRSDMDAIGRHGIFRPRDATPRWRGWLSPPKTPAVPAKPKPRLNWFALLGLLFIPLSVVAGISGFFGHAEMSGRSAGYDALFAGWIAGGVIGLVGMIISLIARRAIAKSDGMLRGGQPAAMGAFLPLVLIPGAMLFSYYLLHTWIQGAPLRQQRRGVTYGFGPVNVRDPNYYLGSTTVEVTGTPTSPDVAKSIARGIHRSINVFARHAAAGPMTIEEVREYVPSDQLGRLDALSPEERTKRGDLGLLGLGCIGAETLPAALESFRVDAISLDRQQSRGTVILRTNDHELEVLVERGGMQPGATSPSGWPVTNPQDASWKFSLAPITLTGRGGR